MIVMGGRRGSRRPPPLVIGHRFAPNHRPTHPPTHNTDYTQVDPASGRQAIRTEVALLYPKGHGAVGLLGRFERELVRRGGWKLPEDLFPGMDGFCLHLNHAAFLEAVAEVVNKELTADAVRPLDQKPLGPLLPLRANAALVGDFHTDAGADTTPIAAAAVAAGAAATDPTEAGPVTDAGGCANTKIVSGDLAEAEAEEQEEAQPRNKRPRFEASAAAAASVAAASMPGVEEEEEVEGEQQPPQQQPAIEIIDLTLSDSEEEGRRKRRRRQREAAPAQGQAVAAAPASWEVAVLADAMVQPHTQTGRVVYSSRGTAQRLDAKLQEAPFSTARALHWHVRIYDCETPQAAEVVANRLQHLRSLHVDRRVWKLLPPAVLWAVGDLPHLDELVLPAELLEKYPATFAHCIQHVSTIHLVSHYGRLPAFPRRRDFPNVKA